MEDTGKAINWDSRGVCKWTATRQDYSWLARSVVLPWAVLELQPWDAYQLLQQSVLTRFLDCASVRIHTLCKTLISRKIGRSGQWVWAPTAYTKHRLFEPLPNLLCYVASFFLFWNHSTHLVFTLASTSVESSEHVAAADATNKACIYNTT